MKSISKLEMTHEEWLAERRNIFGASDSRCIFAPSEEYGSALSVVRKKIEGIDDAQNELMERGIDLEPYAATKWAEKTGMKIRLDNKIRLLDYLDKNGNPFIGCNLDRTIVGKNGDGPGLLELKVTSRTVFESWQGELPAPHFFQTQHQFLVTGYRWGFIGILLVAEFKKFEIVSIPVKPDPALLDDMKWKLEKLWNEYVLERRLPPPETVSDVCSIYPRHREGQFVPGTMEHAALCDRYKESRDIAAEAESVKKDVKSVLIPLIGNSEGIIYNGQTLCTFRASKGGLVFQIDELQRIDPELYLQYVEDVPMFNEAKFMQENPDAWKVYSKEQPGSRRFLVK